MPMTVITLKSVPQALRGDLTRWMQEIATGVYVGNFNSRIREYLWRRVQETMGSGEASMCFAARNEFGYDFVTANTLRSVIDYDGLPLIFIPQANESAKELTHGFSKAAKLYRARNVSSRKNYAKPTKYVILDIETTGLNTKKDSIIEVGAIRCDDGNETCFTELIAYDKLLPANITKLTGIDDALLRREGKPAGKTLAALKDFIGEDDIVGYHISFDVEFLNQAFKKYGLGYMTNRVHDLMRIIKKEQLFQENYQLETSLKSYGINEKVPHRALGDAELIKRLASKLNKF